MGCFYSNNNLEIEHSLVKIAHKIFFRLLLEIYNLRLTRLLYYPDFSLQLF